MNHENYMRLAVEAARTGLGRTWPNPSVGSVLVQDDKVIATTRTANGGRPHAETLALKSKIENQKSKIYVTLEPCAHHGKTPPCAESIVAAGVSEVVIGCLDPDPRTAGKGAQILRDAGIKVTVGVLEDECREMNKGFFKVVEKGVPYVMLKAAISADRKYLSGTGSPRWVTGEKARQEVQVLRSQYDAILTGTGTLMADNPRLDVREKPDYSPIKIVVGKTEIPKDATIFQGQEVWLYPDVDLPDIAKRGITRVMVEAGPKLSNSMLEAGMVDEVIIFQSPNNLGNEGEDFLKDGVLRKLKKTSEEKIGDDIKIIYTLNI